MTVVDERAPTDKLPLPDFLVIGAQKSGTTSLYEYLRSHPQVFMPDIKELDFFTPGINWERGFGWYQRLFTEAGDGVIAVGEASTSYTKWPRYSGSAELIAQHLPQARLIYVIRNPIDRLRSHYVHNVAFGTETASLADAVKRNPDYINFSKYAMQLDQYFVHFGQEQILVITSEALRSQRAATLERVFSFLGVSADWKSDVLEQEFFTSERRLAYPTWVGNTRRWFKKRALGTVKIPRLVPNRVKQLLGKPAQSVYESDRAVISDRLRKDLEEELAPDIRRLRDRLGDDFDGWGIA
ncbi:MAG: sulfotransferase [Actinomycetota bacterium]|nr:sulfotransferase [Actinomycetota bacterium]